MPPKKSNLTNARSNIARRLRLERANESVEQREERNEDQRIYQCNIRLHEQREQRDIRLQEYVSRTRAARGQNLDLIRERDRVRQRTSRALTLESFFRLAFNYAPDINYSGDPKVSIGTMDKECKYCQAIKFNNESPGICCASGKVVLSPLKTPPEPLQSLLAGESENSKLFLSKIRKFNSCFQMTSFGATKICDHMSNGHNFESTFKIQGQVYHKIGSLMPMPDDDPKFLQIYFMGSGEERVSTRCLYNYIENAQ